MTKPVSHKVGLTHAAVLGVFLLKDKKDANPTVKCTLTYDVSHEKYASHFFSLDSTFRNSFFQEM
jgi:hypothetical protein